MNPAARQDPDLRPIEVDARGLRCPLPVIRLAEAARNAPAGTRITVLTSDPAARHDIPAWCRMRGQELCETTEVGAVAEGIDSSGTDVAQGGGAHPAYLRFIVLIRDQPSKADGAGSDSEPPSRAR